MNTRTSVDVQLTFDNGAPMPIGNVVLDAVLYTHGRKRYQFYAGATDPTGRLRLTLDSLEEERQKNQAFSLMDYNTPLAECDPRIDLIVPSPEELKQVQVAIRKWFPENAEALYRLDDNNNGLVNCSPLQVSLIGDGQARCSVSLVCAKR